MSDVSKRANLAVASIRAFCSHHQTLTAVASGVAALLGFSYPALARNYQAFKDLGQGALPVNVFGWAVACMLKPFEGDALSTEPYDRKGPSESWLGSPEEFPYRHGPRPKLGWHFPPQRQVDQIPTEQMKERIMQVFLKAASENLQQLRVGASEAERTDAALFIKGPSPHQTASAFKSEIGHVHAVVDYSMHFVLSPTDCKTGELSTCL
ncbi:hypothetical protein OE88DRAFT_1655117 [Heliocybe sulcata]|uniref:Uncharacterized protein n=1 Tax=Heliocybe sulcata TaxID=5364 RepID=A0A5C3NAV4_9AGAM|nr:hypothetical protein OE88DRAFT_1655117 [Heliocybe sulcata]